LGVTARTRTGKKGVEFGQSGEAVLPDGRYRAVVNLAGTNITFGSTVFFRDITAKFWTMC
jgi:hypothetical protein